MSEFTPGLWDTESHHDETGDWYSVEADYLGKNRVVADTLNRDCVIDPDEDRANARLIAAAPDLLAACKAVVEQLSAHPTLDMTIQCGSDPFAVRICREAIAKATGPPLPGDPP